MIRCSMICSEPAAYFLHYYQRLEMKNVIMPLCERHRKLKQWGNWNEVTEDEYLTAKVLEA